VVLREGEKSEDLYLVKEGILSLSKNLSLPKDFYSELKPPFKLD
jgi:hypothetical protein